MYLTCAMSLLKLVFCFIQKLIWLVFFVTRVNSFIKFYTALKLHHSRVNWRVSAPIVLDKEVSFWEKFSFSKKGGGEVKGILPSFNRSVDHMATKNKYWIWIDFKWKEFRGVFETANSILSFCYHHFVAKIQLCFKTANLIRIDNILYQFTSAYPHEWQ